MNSPSAAARAFYRDLFVWLSVARQPVDSQFKSRLEQEAKQQNATDMADYEERRQPPLVFSKPRKDVGKYKQVCIRYKAAAIN